MYECADLCQKSSAAHVMMKSTDNETKQRVCTQSVDAVGCVCDQRFHDECMDLCRHPVQHFESHSPNEHKRTVNERNDDKTNSAIYQEIESVMNELRPQLNRYWSAFQLCLNDDSETDPSTHQSTDNIKPKDDSSLRTNNEQHPTAGGKLSSWIEESAAPLVHPPWAYAHARRQSAPRRFRGKVLLSAGAAASSRSSASLCTLDSEHLVLSGGQNWAKDLVKLPLSHVIISVHQDLPTSFEIRVCSDATFGCDTRTLLDVSSPQSLNRWLSALCECSATILGWDSATNFESPRLAHGTCAPLVTWLS
jgi:hypothetical protein